MEIRILLADDHELVRLGARTVLEAKDGWKVCAEATTGREAVEKAGQCKPHVAVLDVSMPDLNGLEATRQILKVSPSTEVMILTVHESEQLVRDTLSAGARGYVLKSAGGPDLVAGVQALYEHKPFFSSRVACLVLQGYLSGGEAHPEHRTIRESLTPREREVIQLLAEGRSNKEVATALDINVTTVETHRSNIMHKIGLHSIADLVHYAIRNKIVEA